MQKSVIFSAIGIVTVLAIVFFSQQAYSKAVGKTLISAATDQASAYLAKGSNWVTANVISKIGGEVQSRGDAIKNEVTQEKNKVSENILQKVGNYFSGVGNSITHPGTPQNCPTPQASTK
jgi:hypothetical protein